MKIPVTGQSIRIPIKIHKPNKAQLFRKFYELLFKY